MGVAKMEAVKHSLDTVHVGLCLLGLTMHAAPVVAGIAVSKGLCKY